MASRIIDISGEKFGRLLVLSRDGRGKHGETLWKCLCDCGKNTTKSGQSLRNGNTRSCGCYRRDKMTIHGRCAFGHNHPLYSVWKHMLDRCFNEDHKCYSNYGGRGITVCDSWKVFSNFIADLPPRPPGGTLDRIDNDGNYEPGNVRWADRITQCRNMRSNRLVTYNGETRCIAEWSEITGINTRTLISRINRWGSVSDAIEKPVIPRGTRC